MVCQGSFNKLKQHELSTYFQSGSAEKWDKGKCLESTNAMTFGVVAVATSGQTGDEKRE